MPTINYPGFQWTFSMEQFRKSVLDPAMRATDTVKFERSADQAAYEQMREQVAAKILARVAVATTPQQYAQAVKLDGFDNINKVFKAVDVDSHAFGVSAGKKPDGVISAKEFDDVFLPAVTQDLPRDQAAVLGQVNGQVTDPSAYARAGLDDTITSGLAQAAIFFRAQKISG